MLNREQKFLNILNDFCSYFYVTSAPKIEDLFRTQRSYFKVIRFFKNDLLKLITKYIGEQTNFQFAFTTLIFGPVASLRRKQKNLYKRACCNWGNL